MSVLSIDRLHLPCIDRIEHSPPGSGSDGGSDSGSGGGGIFSCGIGVYIKDNMKFLNNSAYNGGAILLSVDKPLEAKVTGENVSLSNNFAYSKKRSLME